MPDQFLHHTLPNGLTLLCEKTPELQSAALTLLLPAGAATDPPGLSGSAAVLSDLLLRGAGKRDSRQLTDYLDGLGLHRSSNVGVYHARFACAALAARVVESIPAYADVIRRPHLPPDGFRAARDLALQSLAGIEDEPRHKLIILLRKCFLPSPLGRNPMGERSDLRHLTLESCRRDHRRRYHARGAILAIAGNIDFPAVLDQIEQHFGSLRAGTAHKLPTRPPTSQYAFEHHDSQQTHIGVAWPSVAETDAEFFPARVASEILGGMSGHLFTEVREKRGLCYNVSAGYSAVQNAGNIMAYAGTSNDRASQTLQCVMDEIHRLHKGVTSAEVARARVSLAASTIMQEESTSSRAASMAHDFFLFGRIRTLQEIRRAIDSVSTNRVNDYLRRHPPGPFTTVVIGPRDLRELK